MKVTLTAPWDDFVRQLIDSGRYKDASEVICVALGKLRENEGEIFPDGSLKHLYTKAGNADESKLAKHACDRNMSV
jgi:putative addiction module CopG family antidote